MSLQVWLPLTGHLNNQGLSNVTVTNNGATVDNNGKIGKCYYFNGSSQIKISLPASMTTIKNTTVAAWIKSTGTVVALGGISYDSNTYNYSGAVTLYTSGWQFPKSNGYGYIAGGTIVNTQVWHHVCCTIETDLITTYLDGVQVATGSLTTLGSITSLDGSKNFIEIGQDSPGTDERLTGYVNDFRIYDHALSEKEVKELSKGLILHYPLTGGGSSGDNLYKHTYDFSASWGNQSSWATSDETFNTFVVKTKSTTWGGLYQNIDATNGDIFTISFYAKVDFGGTITSIHRSNLGNVTTGLEILDGNFSSETTWVKTTEDGTAWKYYWASVKIISSDITYLRWRIENSISGKTLYISKFKLEYGIHPTPWMPNSADAEYTAMGYNSTTEYDVSGYNNHGTKAGTITYKSDSARYSIASHFINGSYIMANKNSPDYLPKDAITVNLWIRCTTWGNPISCTEGGGFNFENSSGNVGFIVYLSGVGYKTAYGIPVGNLTDGKWHMLTGVYDRINQVVNTYLDAQLMKTTATGSSAVIGYANNRLIISGEAQSTTPASSTFVGEESDVRIYATALTADDVKELYNTAASLANNGTLFAYSFNEV